MKIPWRCKLFGHAGIGVIEEKEGRWFELYGRCQRCGLRSPAIPYQDLISGGGLLEQAIARSTAFFPRA